MCVKLTKERFYSIKRQSVESNKAYTIMLEYSVTIFWQNIITIFTNVLKLYNKDIFFDRFMILASKCQSESLTESIAVLTMATDCMLSILIINLNQL